MQELPWAQIAAFAVHRFDDIDPQEADDLKQDVIVHLLSKRAMIENADDPRGYAQQTASNYVAGYCRGSKCHAVASASLQPTAYSEEWRGIF